jgi:response regulator RpfG family c-di-GMP phosphodiesterase
MMNVDAATGRVPLVLVVDPVVSSRHTLWRTLHRAFGVLEADSAASARTWLARRPDIDALIVHGDLPDARGLDLAREIVDSSPAGLRAVLVAAPVGDGDEAPEIPGLTRFEVGDLRGVVTRLASWLSPTESMLARALVRDADRFFA